MATVSTTPSDTNSGTAGKKPGDRIQCVVVTPERTLFDELVESVVLPLLDGELGILPGRSPLLGRLGYGELRTRSGAGAQRYFVDGGFAQVRDNVVTVLTNRAIPVASSTRPRPTPSWNRPRASRRGQRAGRRERTRLMDRARAMVRVAGHKEPQAEPAERSAGCGDRPAASTLRLRP